MKIVIDSRERVPLDFSPYDVLTETAGLEVGDYSVKGLEHHVAVERKSLSDLIASLTWERERFEREVRRARGLDAFVIAIEGSLSEVRNHRYRSKAKPHSILQSMVAFSVRYGANWIWADDSNGAAYFTFHFLQKFVAESHKRFLAIEKACASDATKTAFS